MHRLKMIVSGFQNFKQRIEEKLDPLENRKQLAYQSKDLIVASNEGHFHTFQRYSGGDPIALPLLSLKK